MVVVALWGQPHGRGWQGLLGHARAQVSCSPPGVPPPSKEGCSTLGMGISPVWAKSGVSVLSCGRLLRSTGPISSHSLWEMGRVPLSEARLHTKSPGALPVSPWWAGMVAAPRPWGIQFLSISLSQGCHLKSRHRLGDHLVARLSWEHQVRIRQSLPVCSSPPSQAGVGWVWAGRQAGKGRSCPGEGPHWSQSPRPKGTTTKPVQLEVNVCPVWGRKNQAPKCPIPVPPVNVFLGSAWASMAGDGRLLGSSPLPCLPPPVQLPLQDKSLSGSLLLPALEPCLFNCLEARLPLSATNQNWEVAPCLLSLFLPCLSWQVGGRVGQFWVGECLPSSQSLGRGFEYRLGLGSTTTQVKFWGRAGGEGLFQSPPNCLGVTMGWGFGMGIKAGVNVPPPPPPGQLNPSTSTISTKLPNVWVNSQSLPQEGNNHWGRRRQLFLPPSSLSLPRWQAGKAGLCPGLLG